MGAEFRRRTPQQCAREAAAVEAEAERWPEDRGEFLLEAAAQWRFAGRPERALPLLQTVVTSGGEDGQFARVEVAALHFDAGDAGAAFAELAALRGDRPLHVAPAHMAAEVLEEHGHLDESLQWFNIATTRLDDDELARVGQDWPRFSYAAQVLAGRRRVRASLGLPEDALDAAVVVPTRDDRAPVFPTAEELLEDLDESPDTPDVVRSLFWPRAEVRTACARWPETFGAYDDDYHARLETTFGELAAQGVRVDLVPATADGLAEFAALYGGTIGERETRHAYMEDCYLRGSWIPWPPPRNGRCWCGSGAKYKKCCGNQAW